MGLTDARLESADLRGTTLTEATLTGANLTRANLTKATLIGADLSNANLSGANLSGANLRGVTGLPAWDLYRDEQEARVNQVLNRLSVSTDHDSCSGLSVKLVNPATVRIFDDYADGLYDLKAALSHLSALEPGP
ncbi:MAG: pentapeptide repeat-containing protein [Cyanobacteriota bacterium]